MVSRDPDLVLRLWKPHGVMTAFTDKDGRETLADHIDVPDVYAAGRLDRDSEGLLLLTRSKQLRTQLMRPDIGHPRTYLVQVEGIPAEMLDVAPDLPERVPPIRVRKSVPDCWIRLTLSEGKNRQVRRMTAAVGHPTLRLVRERIGPIGLDGLAPGRWEALDDEERAALRLSLSEAEATSRPGPGRRRRAPRSRG